MIRQQIIAIFCTQVENTLFKIPRYLLINESPVFADMFRIRIRNESEGIMDTAPIRLQQVECTDFERLLELLYPLCVNWTDIRVAY